MAPPPLIPICRPRLRAVTLVALALCGAMASASSAAALTVDAASVAFNPKKTDAFAVKGTLTGLDPQAVTSVRVELGGFSETIPIASFTQKKGKLSFKGAKKAPGIATLTIDTVKGKFAVAAKGLALKPFDDPAAFRLTAGAFDECATLAFSETPKKWKLARAVPACGFAGVAVVAPKAFFVSTPTDVRVQIPVLDDLALDLASVKVTRLGADLQPTGAPLCTLHDDGGPANGDTTAVDGVFSCRFTVSEPLPGRVRLAVQALRDTTLVLSTSFFLDVVTPLTDGEIATVMTGQDAAGDVWDAVVDELGEGKKARKEAVARILALPNVADAGVTADGASIFIRYTNGLEAGLDLDPVTAAELDPPFALSRAHAVMPPPAARAVETSPDAPRVGNNKVLLWVAFDDEKLLHDAAVELKAVFEASTCPKFEVTVLKNEECNLASLATLPQYGTVVLLTHGAQPHKGGDIAFMSREKATLFGEWYTHATDLKTERLLIYNGQRSPEKKGYYVFYPSFLESLWTATFPNTVVFAAACTGAANRSMANPFFAKGAQAYLGMSDTVFGGFLGVGSKAFFERLVGSGSSAATAYAGVPHKTLKEYLASIAFDMKMVPAIIAPTLGSKLTLLAGDDRVRYPCEPPPPGLVDTVTIQVGAMATAVGTAVLESNATYRVVVTGTAHNQLDPDFSDYDAIYCFASSSDFCNTPFPNADTLYFATQTGSSGHTELENFIELTGSFPAYAGSHRYEGAFTGKSGKLFLETWPSYFPDDGVTRTGSYTVQLFRQ